MFKVVAAAVAFVVVVVVDGKSEEAYKLGFEAWMAKFEMKFHTAAEFRNRFEIWKRADDLIRAHNQEPSSFKLGHNQFSHLTHEEFLRDRQLANFTANNKPLKPMSHLVHDETPMADSVDWVSEGAVTAVKDQGSCGGCWAFSTTGAIEGAYYIKYGELKSYSEQQLISCDTKDSGCNGGDMDYAFSWTRSNGGLCTEDDYPYSTATYNGVTGTCKTTCSVVSESAPVTYTDVRSTESALMSAIEQQPVSVAIEADQYAFQYYSSGVLTGACGTNLDHGVLAVGYGTYDGTDYWKVKNSWAATWGMDGYVLIERGDDKCGILMDASYPTL
ncbi:hypothetical protein CTAYLR_006929 [Chrysophaeum taylorii]|uniref:Uncharacterized protein n=1 Tax=Chrysophaeum taylorii TaxID=2483200 RepID=A0AAD7U979_9STRA|nr:hypothetical protein CTAYLR_006929 [Chrysophaeum taylorii]